MKTSKDVKISLQNGVFTYLDRILSTSAESYPQIDPRSHITLTDLVFARISKIAKKENFFAKTLWEKFKHN